MEYCVSGYNRLYWPICHASTSINCVRRRHQQEVLYQKCFHRMWFIDYFEPMESSIDPDGYVIDTYYIVYTKSCMRHYDIFSITDLYEHLVLQHHILFFSTEQQYHAILKVRSKTKWYQNGTKLPQSVRSNLPPRTAGINSNRDDSPLGAYVFTMLRLSRPCICLHIHLIHRSEDVQQSDCPICFEKMDDSDCRRTSCNHQFHRHCIGRWLEQNRSCPICRKNCN